MADVYQQGAKDDGLGTATSKRRYDLIPPEALRLLADIFTFGAAKYGDRNWERGMDDDRLYAAIMRHIEAVREGGYIDTESGMPNLAHALTGLAMWLTLAERRHSDHQG